jgi:hypothetical protein
MAKALEEFVELANGRGNCGPVTTVIRVERSEQLSKPNLSRSAMGRGQSYARSRRHAG